MAKRGRKKSTGKSRGYKSRKPSVDVDIAMMRPEYEKFRAVAESEFKSPYRADIWCNYRLESDEPSKLTDFSLPQVSRRHFEEFPYSSPFFPLIKIRDERTLFIEFPKERSFNQSIWIDVFPLDSLPPFADKRQNRIFETARLFFAATVHPEIIRDALKNNAPLPVDGDVLQNFIELPYKQRGILLEELLAENFSASEHVGDMREWCLVQRFRSYRSKDFQDIVYLPFETVELPAPAGYDSVLTDFYGDWRTPEKHSSHAAEYSADISWTEYLQKTTGK